MSNETKTKTLHFMIGPVQDFVAQSRRTRDLLASSFLLSYLSGHAMVKIIRQGGSITFPYVHKKDRTIMDPLLRAIDQTVSQVPVIEKPWIGSLPNRFQAEIPEDMNPGEVVEAVHQAWRRVAQAVRDYALKENVLQLGKKTDEIWERQISGFWDITWVMGEDVNLLDRRKNWRSHIPTEEDGDKCTVISQLQELSGFIRIHERIDQQNFWSELRQTVGSYHLNEKERLSAVGLIKRLYPLVSKAALGWELPPSAIQFPSTTHLAVFPWLIKAMREQPELAYQFADVAKSLKLQEIHAEDLFPSIRKEVEQNPCIESFAKLEGRNLLPHALLKELEQPELAHQPSEQKQELQARLHALIQGMKGEAQTYYAVLLMDGDQLGKLLRDKNKTEKATEKVEEKTRKAEEITKQPSRSVQVSQALATFTNGLSELVRSLDGITVYAGGDDVLALLPLDRALPAVVRLREKYIQSFAKIDTEMKGATISAAIVYAHHQSPLQNVIQHAHYLLDHVAKEKSGRDSLAVGTWRGSGADLVWSSPWETVYDHKNEDVRDLDGSDAQPVTCLERLSNIMQKDSTLLSNSFLYKLRELYEGGPRFSEDIKENRQIMIQLLTADYLRIKGWSNDYDRQQVEKQMESLLEVSLRSWYSWFEGKRMLHRAEGEFEADGILLSVFLAQKGVDKRA